MIKYFRKYNIGKCKNRICFINVQFLYKFLGIDLGKLGKRQGRRFGVIVLRVQILRQVLFLIFFFIAFFFFVLYISKLNLFFLVLVSQFFNGMVIFFFVFLVLIQFFRYMQVLFQVFLLVQVFLGFEQVQIFGLIFIKIKFFICVNFVFVVFEVYRRKVFCELS